MKRILCFLLLNVCAFAANDLRNTIAELVLKDGRSLKNVTIVSYARSTVMAKWDGGRGTIPYEAFPDEWRNALEPFRPKASAPKTPPPEPSVTRRANTTLTLSGETDLEKRVSQQGEELDAVRTRVEVIEKRLGELETTRGRRN